MKYILGFFLLGCLTTLMAQQSTFDYRLELIPHQVQGLPGLHSYAFGQHNGKWLIIGGRKDGLHARQPWAAFPTASNNTDIFVVDIQQQQYWSTSIQVLPTSIQEQLQATNMNFYQHEDTLVIIGGYAYSATANDHITFPNMTTVLVSSVMDAVINNNNILPYFQQITNPYFANTGGQLGMMGDTFYLVGGHRFDGRYNPMGNATYTQTYQTKIAKFRINNQASQLSFEADTTWVDPVHLRRRDYNLLPQIFPDGTEGYTISSGVFQPNVDLPFLYPVDIRPNGYTPITNFNQYLSNYHSAKACLYDSSSNQMHNLFFGGLSQYYYSNGTLIQDNNVPFVKTISRLTRMPNNTLEEVQLPIEMPSLKGTSAEFIPNNRLPHTKSEIIKLHPITQDTILIGHIYGGIHSNSLNPFSNNTVATATQADTTIYGVYLIRQVPLGTHTIDGTNPYDIHVYPNPIQDKINFDYTLEQTADTYFFLTNNEGQIIIEGQLSANTKGKHQQTIVVPAHLKSASMVLTVVFDNRFYVTKKITAIN